MTELSPEQRQLLEDAERRVRAAQIAYAPFLAATLKPGVPPKTFDTVGMAACQAELAAAEQELQRLQEELLG